MTLYFRTTVTMQRKNRQRERESYFKHSRYTHEQTHTVGWLAHGMRSIS